MTGQPVDPGPDLSHIVEALRALAVPLADLIPDDANARKHDEANLAAIENSLRRFGQMVPVVVERESRVVRAGNGRLMAAKRLGWEHIAAVVVDHAKVEMVAYAIADNRTAELAEWDEAVLSELLRALDEQNVILDDLGFSSEDLDRLLSGGVGTDDLGPPEPGADAPVGQFAVMLVCRDEADQERVYERVLVSFGSEGREIRVVNT